MGRVRLRLAIMSIQMDSRSVTKAAQWKPRNSNDRNNLGAFLAFEVGCHCDFRIEQPGDWTILFRLFRSFVESSLAPARDLGFHIEMNRCHSEPGVSLFER